MKKKLLIFLTMLSVVGCGKQNQGELVGEKQKKFHEQKPHGMSLIPGGSFIMGSSDEDILASNDNATRTVTISSFWMDEHEISNSEYRQFVEWVKDSIIKTELTKLALDISEAQFFGDLPNADELKEQTDAKPILEYLPLAYIKDADDEDAENLDYINDLSYYANNSDDISLDEIPYFSTNEAPDSVFHYHLPLNKMDVDYESEEFGAIKDKIYLPEDRWFTGDPTIDIKILKYRFSTVNMSQAVANPDSALSKYTKYEAPVIYPDTTVWIKDFEYSYNEPMHNRYFWHPAFSDFPVVGVNWHQARAFAHWRTKIRNDYLRSRKKRSATTANFRLPTESEWEYAARGGLESAIYPWGGPYLTDDRGCFMANFKPKRGNYAADGYLYPVETDSFEPNDYGLYNMSGNVSEWTSSSYNKNSYEFGATFNADYDMSADHYKVVRGGSWKDVKHYLKVATRDYEVDSVATSYIGFRLVKSSMQSKEVFN